MQDIWTKIAMNLENRNIKLDLNQIMLLLTLTEGDGTLALYARELTNGQIRTK
jgi:hypothetical protein